MKRSDLLLRSIGRGFLLSLFIITYHLASAQDMLGLREIVHGSYAVGGNTAEQGIVPTVLNTTGEGGILEVAARYNIGNQRCTERYRFEWRFSIPVDQLSVGQSFNVEYKVTSLGNSCTNFEAKMIVMDGMGFSPEFKATGIRGVGGINVPSRQWINSGASSQTATVGLTVTNSSSKYATIKLNFENTRRPGNDQLHYEVVYLFEKGYQPQVNCDPDMNCHNLYSLGVLIGFAEYGADKDDSPSFVAAQLTSAIEQAVASKCVAPDEIIMLRDRVRTARSSRALHGEISALRQKIALFVEKNCNCCK